LPEPLGAISTSIGDQAWAGAVADRRAGAWERWPCGQERSSPRVGASSTKSASRAANRVTASESGTSDRRYQTASHKEPNPCGGSGGPSGPTASRYSRSGLNSGLPPGLRLRLNCGSVAAASAHAAEPHMSEPRPSIASTSRRSRSFSGWPYSGVGISSPSRGQ
jgi:hypothetical protein